MAWRFCPIKPRSIRVFRQTANAAYSLGKRADYDELVSYFFNMATTTDLKNLKIENSIVWSSGKPLLNETLALWCIALLKNKNNPDLLFWINAYR